MKDELRHLVTVNKEFIAKILAGKIYAKFGCTVRWSDTNSLNDYTVDIVDDGSITNQRFNYISGYAVGVLEMLEKMYL